MVRGQYSVIRSADGDDAPDLQRLYCPQRPMSALFNKYYELNVPSKDEVAQLLTKPNSPMGKLCAIEDLEGVVQGYCAVRGANLEVRYAEICMMLHEDAAYASELGDEALAYLTDLAMNRQGMRKLVVNCLSCETAWRDLLLRTGFASNGVQRQVYFGKGQWWDMESLSLFKTTDITGAEHAT